MLKNQPIVSGDVFVIPNGLRTIKDILCLDVKAQMEQTFYANDLNGLKQDQDQFVELWFCTPGNKDSNWVDHCVDPLHEEISKEDFLAGRDQWRVSTSLVPVELFKGHKEGDVVTLKLPIQRHTGKGTLETAWIKASLALAQTKYRYKRFGKFEDLINR